MRVDICASAKIYRNCLVALGVLSCPAPTVASLPRLQLLRERPPGFGGVERVAHELACQWNTPSQASSVFYLASDKGVLDPIHVTYHRFSIPTISLGRLRVPLPSVTLLRLLAAPAPLHVHLPCPSILFLAFLARLIRPSRPISVHWHSFLDVARTPFGLLYGLYERLALQCLGLFSPIVTTSPILAADLKASGVSEGSLRVLPCCLPLATESYTPRLPRYNPSRLSLIFIGRLDSYKRVDWLIDSLAEAVAYLSPLSISAVLHIVGDGPYLTALTERSSVVGPGLVFFHGRISELSKLELLAQCDLLLMPSDSCHEAFGIVQLEAMCLDVPALALSQSRSGVNWVSALPSLPGPFERSDLSKIFIRLALDRDLLSTLRLEARCRYLDTFSRRVWSDHFKAAFA